MSVVGAVLQPSRESAVKIRFDRQVRSQDGRVGFLDFPDLLHRLPVLEVEHRTDDHQHADDEGDDERQRVAERPTGTGRGGGDGQEDEANASDQAWDVIGAAGEAIDDLLPL